MPTTPLCIRSPILSPLGGELKQHREGEEKRKKAGMVGGLELKAGKGRHPTGERRPHCHQSGYWELDVQSVLGQNGEER